MGPPRRNLLATAAETLNPPDSLSDTQFIARVVKAEGNNLYSVTLASGKTLLVELPSRFRSTIWLKRGGYVLVDTEAFNDRENKLDGEIVNVVRDEKQWRKETYWSVSPRLLPRIKIRQLTCASTRPKEFVKTSSYLEDTDEEDSVVGKMPPTSDSDSES